jgi:thiamine pyrophosphokinase
LPSGRARIQLIAVDGGLYACRKRGWRPDLSVGDWDSLGAPPSGTHLTLERDKSRSDFYFALRAAYEGGARELIAYGVTGGRSDHHLAALQDLAEAAAWRGVVAVTAVDAQGQYVFVPPSASRAGRRIRLKRGRVFSVLAWPGAARGVTVTGAAQYLLRSEGLAPGSRGLSNFALGGEVRISVRGGGLLVFVVK